MIILSVASPVLQSLNIFQVLEAKVILQLRLDKKCFVGICCNKAITYLHLRFHLENNAYAIVLETTARQKYLKNGNFF